MNRRGFLSLFSAAPAVAILPTIPLEKSTPAPTPEPEFMVHCIGPICRGPGSYTLNHTGYAVPRSQCACEMMRVRNAHQVPIVYDGNNWRTLGA